MHQKINKSKTNTKISNKLVLLKGLLTLTILADKNTG